MNLRSFPSQSYVFSEWKGFNEGGFEYLDFGFDDVFVDSMQINFIGSEKVSVPVSPFFFVVSALHNCVDGTELIKVDASQFNGIGVMSVDPFRYF